MIRTIFPLISAVMFLASSADAQTKLVGEDSEIFVNAITAFEKKDFQTAVELFKVLADQGEPTSQHNLSILYFKGLGSPTNYKRALYWGWRASLGGSEPALALVDDVRDIVTDH